MKSTSLLPLMLLAGSSSVVAACAPDGTLVTVQTSKTSIPNATDQALLADAIDQAFDQLDIAGMRAKLKASGATSAYLEVAAPFASTKRVI